MGARNDSAWFAYDTLRLLSPTKMRVGASFVTAPVKGIAVANSGVGVVGGLGDFRGAPCWAIYSPVRGDVAVRSKGRLFYAGLAVLIFAIVWRLIAHSYRVAEQQRHALSAFSQSINLGMPCAEAYRACKQCSPLTPSGTTIQMSRTSAHLWLSLVRH